MGGAGPSRDRVCGIPLLTWLLLLAVVVDGMEMQLKV